MQLDAETRKKLSEMRRKQILGGSSGYRPLGHSKPSSHKPSTSKKIILVRKPEIGRDVPYEQMKQTSELLVSYERTAPGSEIEQALRNTQKLPFQRELLEYLEKIKDEGVHIFSFSLKIPAFKDQTVVYWANRFVYNADTKDFFDKSLTEFLLEKYNPFVIPGETEKVIGTYSPLEDAVFADVLNCFDANDWKKVLEVRGCIDQIIGSRNEVTEIYEIGRDRRG
jgi:hypothetical protein